MGPREEWTSGLRAGPGLDFRLLRYVGFIAQCAGKDPSKIVLEVLEDEHGTGVRKVVVIGVVDLSVPG